jgi:hypothetical protein
MPMNAMLILPFEKMADLAMLKDEQPPSPKREAAPAARRKSLRFVFIAVDYTICRRIADTC